MLQQGKLRCRAHPGQLAAALCSACGCGICRQCAVSFEGGRYCRADAEMVLKARRAAETKGRSRPITVASAFSLLGGSLALGLGFLFIILGLVAPSMQTGDPTYSMMAQSLSFFGPVFAYSSTTILTLGAEVFSVGIVGIGAGLSLWKSSRLGAVLAAGAAVGSAAISLSYFEVFSVMELAVYAVIVIAVADVAAIILGWSRLR